DCNEFSLSISFENSQLNHAVFYQLKIKKTIFKNCQMIGCDFTEADLSESVFEKSNLQDAQFDRTQLQKADFRTAYNFSIDPELNNIKNAKFSKENLVGLLDKYNLKIE